MSYSLNGSSNDNRVEELTRQHAQRRTRFFLTFAIIEGMALAAGVVVVYVLNLVDPEQGIWILVVIAFIGAVVMSVSLQLIIRRQAQEMRDITGG